MIIYIIPYKMIYWQKCISGEFACGKLIAEFYIGDFIPRAIEHA